MSNRKKDNSPVTQHKKIAAETRNNRNHFTVLDNPDDRITEQTGDGTTMVVIDNPDDIEDKI
jgi:hypothetical protein